MDDGQKPMDVGCDDTETLLRLLDDRGLNDLFDEVSQFYPLQSADDSSSTGTNIGDRQSANLDEVLRILDEYNAGDALDTEFMDISLPNDDENLPGSSQSESERSEVYSSGPPLIVPMEVQMMDESQHDTSLTYESVMNQEMLDLLDEIENMDDCLEDAMDFEVSDNTVEVFPSTSQASANQVGRGGDSQEPTFTLRVKNEREVKKYNSREVTHEIRLHAVENSTWKDHLNLIGNALETSLEKATADLHDEDLVRVFVNQKSLQTPIVVKLDKKSNVSASTIVKNIEKVLQSQQSMQFDDTFEMNIGTIKLPRGGTGSKISNKARDIRNKKSIIRIENRDNMCLARAIAVCMAYISGTDTLKMRKKEYALQRKTAEDLCAKAGIDPTTLCGLEEVKTFEETLDVQIVVISGNHLNKIIHKGLKPRFKKLFLYLNDNHFDAVINVKAFFGRSYFCEHCLVSYNHKDGHKCDAICHMCYTAFCGDEEPIDCSACNRTFRNQRCYDIHKQKGFNPVSRKILDSICETKWKCKDCQATLEYKVRSPADHVCYESYCRYCKIHYKGEHRCFIQPADPKKPHQHYIFFDFECSQETGVHVPNFAVAQKTCPSCIDQEIINSDTRCDVCGEREKVFSGPNTATDFASWLFSPEHRQYIAFAHNAKAYDSVFLLKYLIENAVIPSVILSGLKIMELKVEFLKIRVLDSFNHISTGLANFPKTFGLTELKKGWFAHYFNTSANADYVGEIPQAKYFGPESMSEKNRAEFLKWHSEQKGKIFDLRKEIYEYCKSDVDILRRCCLKFRQLIMSLTKTKPTAIDIEGSEGIDPLTYVTISGLCFGIFRTLFLHANTVARVPAEGIASRDQYSKISIQWLMWEMKKARDEGKTLHIQHALNMGEKRVGKYRLDGWEKSTNTVYSFCGCYYHACGKCFKPDQFNSKVGVTMEYLRNKTFERRKALENLGLNYIEQWECGFRQEIANNYELKRFTEQLDIQPRLDPRDAFFGGRTNATRLLYKAKKGERIKYVDFTSLYPFVNKYKRYPLAYPTIITSDFKHISAYFGFAKVKVLPPRGLYHPVLPYKTDKLLFPLCRTCADTATRKCSHSGAERALIGTWVTEELQYALKKGYKLLKIYEIYHFPRSTVYDGKDAESGLFSNYINTFLAIKQQASGWPDWCQTPEHKAKYIRDYKEHEGIQLDENLIEKNPGLRSVAKNVLNHTWGKFSQRNSLPQTTFVSEASDFLQHLTDAEKCVDNFRLLSDEIALLEWHRTSEAAETAPSSNIYIGAFTTAYARLELYKVLEKLGKRVLYMDTDSLVFVSRDGEYEPPLGDYLGQLTDELGGDFIVIFVSGGPKNYAYITQSGKEVVKVRGFSLNYKNSRVINMAAMEDMVREVVKGIADCPCGIPAYQCDVCRELTSTKRTVINENKITRDKSSFNIVNKRETKDYRICYTKRVIQPDFDTLPFGY